MSDNQDSRDDIAKDPGRELDVTSDQVALSGREDRKVAPNKHAGSAPEAVGELLETIDQSLSDTNADDQRKSGSRSGAKNFGDYELIAEIARGGMGIVFKARQVRLNRTVALKMILSGQYADEQAVKRFHSEAEAAAKLDHPGIVPIFEIGEHRGIHFFSMGFVEGQSLADRLREGPLPPTEAAQLLVKICDAVSYAHGMGVVHRDLKPGNVLIDENGIPKVTDFGLAKHVEGDSELTKTGQVLGTPSYMPPEQASGSLDEIGPLSDVYSLGAILYCMLTGRPPFQAATAVDTVLQVLNRDPVAPRILNPQLPKDLGTICLKCLNKPPRHRYGNADELADDLKRWAKREPIRARRTSTTERVVKWSRRRPTAAALIATSLLALVAVGVAISAYVYSGELNAVLEQATKSREIMEIERQRASDALDEATEANQRAERANYYRRIALADVAWRDNRIMEMKMLLDATPEAHRHWEYALLSENRLRGTIRVGLKHPPSDLVVSDDGSQIIVATLYGPEVVRWRNAADLKELDKVEEESNPDTRLCADARHIVFQMRSGEFRLVDGRDKQVIASWNLPPEYCREFCVAPHAGWIGRAVGTREDPGTTLSILSVDQSIGERRLRSGFSITKLLVSADGSSLIVAGTDAEAREDVVAIYDTSSWQRKLIDRFQGRGVTAIAVDAEHDRILVGYQNRSVRVIKLTEGSLLFSRELSDVTASFDAAPDGRISVGFNGGEVQIWDHELKELLRRLRGHLRKCSFCRFLPDDGDLITASEDLSVRRWILDSPEVPIEVAGESAPQDRPVATAFAWRPDSRQIAIAKRGASDRAVVILRNRLGAPQHRLEYEHVDSSISFLAYRSKEEMISVDVDGRVMTWDLGGLPEVTATLLCELPAPIDAAEISVSRRRLLSASDKRVSLVDLDTGTELANLVSGGLGVRSVCFAFTEDQALVASKWNKKNADGFLIELCRLSAGKKKAIFDRMYIYPTVVRMVENENAFVVSDEIGQVMSRNATTGSPIWGDSAHLDRVRALAVTPDDRRVVSCCDRGSVRLRDTATGENIMTLQQGGEAVVAADFSPDNRSLAVIDEIGGLKIWAITKAP